MAKFCKYCGTPLAEGQVCTCPQAQADAAGAQPQFTQQQYTQPPQQQYTQQQYTQPPQQPKGPSPVGSAFHNLVPFLKAYMRSPADAVRSALTQRDMFLPIILLVIQMLAVGLTIFGVLNKICSIPRAQMGGMGSVSVSILWCLIAGILTAAIAMIIYILLMFAVAKIMGAACSFQDVLIASGANSLYVTAGFLLSFLLFFVSLKVGFFLLLLVLVVWLGISFVTVQAVIPNHTSGKFWLCYLVALLISLSVTSFAIPRTNWMAVKSISFSYGTGRDRESYTLGEMMEEEGVRSFDDLLDEMMSEIF